MSLADECNLLKNLYESKYHRLSEKSEKGLSNLQNLKKIVATFNNSSIQDQLTPTSMVHNHKMIRNYSHRVYNSAGLPNNLSNFENVATRQVIRRNSERKTKSVVSRELFTSKNQEQISKNTILHSKQAFLKSLFNHRKPKQKITESTQVNTWISYSKQLANFQPYKATSNANKISITNTRKSKSVAQNRKKKETEDLEKKQQLFLEPWGVDIDEFL